MRFSVQLDTYRGPLDLLLYLVRKHEVAIADLPIAQITQQYLDYLDLLKEIDFNAVGEFLEMASTLIEVKSRLVLPHGDETEEPLEDPRNELVQRLLEYKKYKDAASMLEERGRQWQLRFPRMANDLPTREIDLAQQPIHEVELWDLVSAFGRVMRENTTARPTTIVYDDTPIGVHMQRIHDRLVKEGKVSFTENFHVGMHKSSMIGMFLAILELCRHHNVHAEQAEMHGEIWITPGEDFKEAIDSAAVDEYGQPSAGT